MATADLDAFGVGRNQRQGNAQRLFIAQQVVRVIGLEGQAEHGGNRAQGDVALLPGNAQAQHLFAVELPFADNTLIGHGAGIRAGIRRSQGKAGDVFAPRQARQIVLFLLIGTVVHQQLGGPQGIGDHDCGAQITAAAGQFHGYLGVGIGREALAAKLLGNDQAEEAVVPNELPDVRRQVLQVGGQLPFVGHAAEFFDRTIKEGLFFRTQVGRREAVQLAPVRAAAEQFAIPPHGTCIKRLLLGIGERWQNLAEPGEQRRTDAALAPFGQIEGDGNAEEQCPQQ